MATGENKQGGNLMIIGDTEEVIQAPKYFTETFEGDEVEIICHFFQKDLRGIVEVGWVMREPDNGPVRRLIVEYPESEAKRIKPLLSDLKKDLCSLPQQEISCPTDKRNKFAVYLKEKENDKDVLVLPDIADCKVKIIGKTQENVDVAAHYFKIKTGEIKVTERGACWISEPSEDKPSYPTIVAGGNNKLYPNIDEYKKRSFKENSSQFSSSQNNFSGSLSSSWRSSAGSSTDDFMFETKLSGGMLLKVYKASITRVNVDAIVNATNDTMMHGGGVARVISEAAGYALDRESREYIDRYGPLGVSKNIVTTAGRLPYKAVIHAVGPMWHDYKRNKKLEFLDDLYDCVWNILDTCKDKGYRIVAMSAISAGMLSVPKELCADMYLYSADKFSKSLSATDCPEELHIIDVDTTILKLVEQSVERWKENPESINQRNTLPKYLEENSHQGSNVTKLSGGMLLKVYKASITRLDVDAIVNAANDTMMHGSGVARVISEAAGYALDRESREYIDRYGPLAVSKNIVTTAGRLPYKAVIHAVGPMWHDYKRNEKLEFLDDLFDCVWNILDTCKDKGYRRVAMSAISAGMPSVPKELCADMYLYSADKFSKSLSATHCPEELHIIDVDTTILKLVEQSVERWKENPESINHRNTLPKYLEENPHQGSNETKLSGGMLLKVYKASITRLDVDAIVNAANDTMMHGGGVARVISEAAGYALDRESREYIDRYGPLGVSKNIVTTAGRLPYKAVIHAVGPMWHDYKRNDKLDFLDDLFDCVWNILDTCKDKGYRRVAMSAISAGMPSVPKELCADMYLYSADKFSKSLSATDCPEELHIIDVDTTILKLVEQSVERWKENPESINQRITLPKYLEENPHQCLAYQTGVSVSFTHAGNIIWCGVPDESRAVQWHALDDVIAVMNEVVISYAVIKTGEIKVKGRGNRWISEPNEYKPSYSYIVADGNNRLYPYEKRRFKENSSQFSSSHNNFSGSMSSSWRSSASSSTDDFMFETKLSGGMLLKVYKASITRVNVDAIVNAATDTMMHGGGVARVISEAAGYALDRESRKYINRYGPLGVSKNIVTTAGRLPYKAVIHAVGPMWHDYKRNKKLDFLDDLYDCVWNILDTCKDKGYRRVAMSAISAGMSSVPKELCADMYLCSADKFSKSLSATHCPEELHIIDVDTTILKLVEQSVERWKENPESINQRNTLPKYLEENPHWAGYSGSGGQRSYDGHRADRRHRGGNGNQQSGRFPGDGVHGNERRHRHPLPSQNEYIEENYEIRLNIRRVIRR